MTKFDRRIISNARLRATSTSSAVKMLALRRKLLAASQLTAAAAEPLFGTHTTVWETYETVAASVCRLYLSVCHASDLEN